MDEPNNTSSGNVQAEKYVDPPKPAEKKPASFWLSMFSLMIATFLAALDTGAVATALPTIIDDLQGKEFVWIGSAYTLAGVAFLPMSGHLANIFGRRPILLIFLSIFALGSALCGAAQSMDMLIGGRTVQGVGAGGILSLTEIILSDLVPLSERGAYQGMIGLIWSIASIVGPIIGGAFAQRRDFTWRGLFYLNLPLTGISMVLCLFFLNLKIPHQRFSDKFRRIDWIGNFIVVGSSTAALLGLTWGGVRFPWSSVQVLTPFILGIVGLLAFILYEIKVPTEPTVPLRIIANRTSISGYIGTGLQGLVISAALFYLPVYFQACKGVSPLQSGIDMLPYSFSVAPFAIVAGGTATAFNRYKPQNIIAWVFITVGMGLQSTLHVNSAVRNWVGFQIVAGIGFGMLFTATTFPILAPLHVRDNANALSLFIFIRSFFQAWGITIGATVLQNELLSRLPQDFLSSLPQGIEISYAAIPQINGLAEPLRGQVRAAFADSLDVLWEVMIAIAGVGLLSSFFMKEMPLQDVTDETWGLKNGLTEKRNNPNADDHLAA
ncbi:iron permease [Hysterangium stoloniferum]|nr:iron permease [Hysterangium stoloniferum]